MNMSDTVADTCRPPGVDQLISTRLQLKIEDKVKLCFVCSGPAFFFLFVGRTAETEWVASAEAPVAKSVRDPPWMPKHIMPTVMDELDGSRRDQVVVYEGAVGSGCHLDVRSKPHCVDRRYETREGSDP